MNQEVIEIFLFIDPLGNQCFKSVKMLSHVLEEREENIVFRIIPIVNAHKIRRAVDRCDFFKEEGGLLERQNHLYMNTYRAALAFNAATMQGKQKGKELLDLLQEKVVHEKRVFSLQLLLEVIQQIDVDREMFIEDFHSELAKRCFRRDQQLAAEMGIHSTPSCVVIHTSDERGAYRLEGSFEESIVNYLIDLPHQAEQSEVQYIQNK